MKRNVIYVILLITFLISSCSQSGETNGENVSSPESGMANVFGKVLLANKQPAEGRVVRLAKVFRGENENGTFILDEAKSPSSVSDSDGSYEFLNIEPGEYVLLIKQLDSSYMAVSDVERIPNIYQINPDENLNIEPIVIVDN